MNTKKLLHAVFVLTALLSLAAAGSPTRTALANTSQQNDLNATILAAPVVSSWSVSPWAAPADGSTQVNLIVSVNDPDGDLARVTVDLSALGGAASAELFDDGVHSDGGVQDGLYGLVVVMPSGVPVGELPLNLTARDSQGNQTVVYLGTFALLSPTNAPWPAALPDQMGWGTSEDDWQEETGLPWNYVSHFLTWNWQDWNDQFVRQYVQDAWALDEIPILTLDMLLGAADCGALSEKDCDFAHLQDSTVMAGYFARVTEAAIQAQGSEPVIFHIESDASAYMHRYSIENEGQNGIVADEPDTIPAKSLDANYPNTYAGVIQRMVDIIHTNAPNALVALHARSWATGMDVAGNTDPDLNVAEIGRRVAHFLSEAGGPDLDLLLSDWKVWDAGMGGSPWWDNTNRVLPHYSRILYWQNQIVANANLPMIVWKVPAGNMTLENVCQRYQDNRVDYAFEHPRDLMNAGIRGVVVGGGDNCRTVPSTDDNNIFNKGTVFFARPAAPASFSAVTAGSPGLVKLTWQPHADFDVVGYQVYIGRSIQTLAPYLDVQGQTSLHLLLPEGGTWYVSVTATDASGQESPAATAAKVILDAPYRVTLPMVVH
jgi:hypothetical protein